jgi:ATP-dependent protease ClpP protease subunit
MACDRERARGEGRGFSMRAEASQAEILLYDPIDPWYGISAKQFYEQLKALGEVESIDLRINSPGGMVTEGTAIYSILKRHAARVTAHIDGIAASIASVVAMAADEIVMAQGAYMMIHSPLGMAIGDAEELRDYADVLDKMKSQIVRFYADRTKRPADEIEKLMDAETWFTAEEAVAAGFADRTSARPALAAAIDPARFMHFPDQLKLVNQIGAAQMSQAEVATPPAPPQPAAYGELKAALVGADPAFICAQLEATATLAQAQTAWMAEQNRRLEAANKLAQENKAKAEEAVALAAAKSSGIKPLGIGQATNGDAAGDPIAEFTRLVNEALAAGKPRAKAVSDVIAANPQLHADYLEAYNALHKK